MAKTSAQKRNDSWVNFLTKLNVEGLDKKTGAKVYEKELKVDELEALYQADDLAARIVDRPVEDMTREGFEVHFENDQNESMESFFWQEWERLRLDEHVERGLKWARIYGGAGLIAFEDDLMSSSLELNLNNLQRINFFFLVDKFNLNPSKISEDISDKNFGKPEFFEMSKNSLKIHYSKVIRFEGVELPFRLAIKRNGWGDSIFCRIYDTLRNYQTGHSTIGTIIQDFTQTVWKMADLQDIVSQKGQEALLARLQLAQRMGSSVNALVIRNDEEMERKTTAVTGINDLMNILNSRLVASTDIPHTILLGESPSGLGASGESEKRDWYDHIKNRQESVLRPILNRLINLIFAQRTGITKGVIPVFDLSFKSLWQMDQKSELETRKIQADIDQIYLTNGVLDPDEVKASRFVDGNFDFSTKTESEIAGIDTYEQGEEEDENGQNGSVEGDE